jgi:hypothetical protein
MRVNNPIIPDRLRRLPEIAGDLWWTWNTQAREVFRQLDYPLWRQTAHNPVLMLRNVSQEMLNSAVSDPKFLATYDGAVAALDAARSAKDTWWQDRYPDVAGPIAYFSAEFALHQSLPIYAGGLGVLAGDHCKEASDLGIPLIGIGFMYPQGYFHQKVTAEGWQEESYERLTWADAPIEPAVTADGSPCIVAVPLGNRTVLVQVWRVRLGRVKLYLLDTRRSFSVSAASVPSGRSARRPPYGTSMKGTRRLSCCSGFAICSKPDRHLIRLSRKCGVRPCSRRTLPFLPGMTRFRSISSRRISPVCGARSGHTATRSSRLATTTTAAARCST